MKYRLLRIMLKIAGRMPFWLLYALSAVLYVLIYRVVRYRRRIVRRNLTECFPEKTPADIRRIERRFYRNFADQLVETCKMGGMSPVEMSRRMRFVNIGDVNASLRAGRSVALFIGHYGNWEWVSSMPIGLEKSALAAQIYHHLHDKSFNRIICENRTAFGAVNVDMYQTARFIRHLADEGTCSIIGFIADQSPKRRDAHYFVPFLHHDTPVLTGTEKIVRHFGFEPWFLDVRKLSRGHYEARFVPMQPDPGSTSGFGLTDTYFKMLENMIRRNPELYLWTHNRFKYACPLDGANTEHNL